MPQLLYTHDYYKCYENLKISKSVSCRILVQFVPDSQSSRTITQRMTKAASPHQRPLIYSERNFSEMWHYATTRKTQNAAKSTKFNYSKMAMTTYAQKMTEHHEANANKRHFTPHAVQMICKIRRTAARRLSSEGFYRKTLTVSSTSVTVNDSEATTLWLNK